MNLYHYTTVDSFVRIWVSQSLKFSEVKLQNDIFERAKIISLKGYVNDDEVSNVKDLLSKLTEKVFNQLQKFKQISFSIDSKDRLGAFSPMMWGQYAKNERGVCIEFDSAKLLKSNKIYWKEIEYLKAIPVNSIVFNGLVDDESINNLILTNKDLFFFTKYMDWEHENEFRVISNELDFLPITDAITKVYVYSSKGIGTDIVLKLLEGYNISVEFIELKCSKGFVEMNSSDLLSYRNKENRINNNPKSFTDEKVLKEKYEYIKKTFNI